MVAISDWARQYIIAKAKENMNCTVTIWRWTSGNTLNATTNVFTKGTGVALYTGIARVWSSQDGQVAALGGADIDLTTVTISIPQDAGYNPIPDDVPNPARDDVIEIIAHPHQPDLVNTVYRVLSCNYGGSLADALQMTCQKIARNRVWEQSP